jgi:hypothetical protein
MAVTLPVTVGYVTAYSREGQRKSKRRTRREAGRRLAKVRKPDKNEAKMRVAEAVRFELTEGSLLRRFSRPVP